MLPHLNRLMGCLLSCHRGLPFGLLRQCIPKILPKWQVEHQSFCDLKFLIYSQISMNPLKPYTASASGRNVTEPISRLPTFPSSFSPPTRYYNDLPSGRNLHSPPAMSSSTGFESSRYTTPLARSMHSPSSSVTSTSFDTSRFPIRRDGRHFSPSPPQVSPPHSEFHPRLYPGSVRHAARTMAVNRSSYPSGPTTIFTEPDWRKLIEAENERDARPLEKEPQQQPAISTSIAETPVESVHSHSQSQADSSVSSSLVTASSPTFSALAHSPASGINDVRACSFFRLLFLSLISSVTLSSQRLDQPQLRPPMCHHLVFRLTRSLLTGEFPKTSGTIDLMFVL